MKATVISVTSFQQNCSLLWCEQTQEGVVVDPGGHLDQVLRRADQVEAKVVKILLTHGHIDHVGGAGKLAKMIGIPIEGPHQGDQFWLDQLPDQCAMFGFPPTSAFTPDRWLEEGDRVSFANEELDVLHCPGHTPGHVVFFHRSERLAIVGDVLFKGSIGRTDFPRSNYGALIRSIRDKLWPLGDDVVFIPGHGPLSTFGQERRTNPFVADSAEPI